MYKMIESKFRIEWLGQLTKHLGIWWEWKTDSQGEKYLIATMPKMIKEIQEKYKESTGKEAKPCFTPGFPGKVLIKNTEEMIDLDAYRSLVGKIMYYTTKIAPEISSAARELATHLSNPGKLHWKSLERCVGYIIHKTKDGLIYRRPRNLTSISYCDSDYATDPTDRKSISGRLNTLGGTLTNWTSKKRSTVALSSTEAEYMALSECSQESVFTQNLIEELTGIRERAIIYEDNLGAIYLVKNQQVSARTKHIDVRHHFVRDLYEDKRIEVRFQRSENNPSDLLTKNTTC